MGISCNNERVEANEINKPSKILSKQEMINVMVDFRLTEGVIRQMISAGNEPDFATSYYYEAALKENKIDIKTFEENMNYYSSDPDAMDEIYSAVVDSLVLLQSKSIAQ